MEERKKIMEIGRLLDFLKTAEQLKCNTRHSYTSSGRLESVAEHSWRLALMAMLVGDEFPELDMDKVIKMCLIHDMGEAITGDIPAFEKTDKDRKVENKKVEQLTDILPEPAVQNGRHYLKRWKRWRHRRRGFINHWISWRR